MHCMTSVQHATGERIPESVRMRVDASHAPNLCDDLAELGGAAYQRRARVEEVVFMGYGQHVQLTSDVLRYLHLDGGASFAGAQAHVAACEIDVRPSQHDGIGYSQARVEQGEDERTGTLAVVADPRVVLIDAEPGGSGQQSPHLVIGKRQRGLSLTTHWGQCDGGILLHPFSGEAPFKERHHDGCLLPLRGGRGQRAFLAPLALVPESRQQRHIDGSKRDGASELGQRVQHGLVARNAGRPHATGAAVIEVLRGGRSQRNAGGRETLDSLARLQSAQDFGGDAAITGTEAAADALARGQFAVHPDRAAAERVALPFSGVRAIAGVAAVGVKHGEAII